MRHPRRFFESLLTALAIIALLGGLYMLLLVISPSLPGWLAPWEVNVQKLVNSTATPTTDGDRLFIPQIGVDVAIVKGKDASALNGGAWHRQPQNGDPIKGGNFVLSAHRFSMGFTPQETRAKSPFYRIDQLKIGDEFFVDYHGKRYAYRVSRTYDVPRTAVEIEAPSTESKLTLYSCDLRGEAAGRVVVEARPVRDRNH